DTSLKIMKPKIRKIIYSVILIILVLYPNIYLAGKQIINQIEGIESLTDPNDTEVIKLAEYLNTNNINPEEYIYENIEWASDYDVYWNLEYWATPRETIRKGRGDCEDKAILLKSVEEYLRIKSQIVVQKDHVYVLKDDIPYGGISETDSYMTVLWNIIKQMPLIRKIIIIFGLFMIWGGHKNLRLIKKRYLSS
ncbi:MAG: hypothetical protein KAV48_06775, partial [Methanomicrobia archaeon]|nr:hypothetical protein [Methanomicrobia archaeon]